MKCILVLLAFLATPVAFAGPGLWSQPDRDGHGLSISQASSGGHAVIWYRHRVDGSSAFLLAEPCQTFPCATILYEPSARWGGGDLDLGDPVGSLEIFPDGDQIRVIYDIRAWNVERCENISPGGALFRECAGSIRLTKLAD